MGITRGRDAVFVVGDGRMFEAAAESKFNLLSEWAKAPELWIRFLRPEQAGCRIKLELDPDFGPIADLATCVQGVSTPADNERLELE